MILTVDNCSIISITETHQSTNSAALNGFSDKGKVSSYAVEAMNWAVTQKIMTGKGNGKLDPQGYATRAECASMIKSFLLANYKKSVNFIRGKPFESQFLV